MTSIGLVEILIVLAVLALFMASFTLLSWAIVDAASRPGSQWAAEQHKRLWVGLLIVGAIVPVLGLVLLFLYLGSVRPKLTWPPSG